MMLTGKVDSVPVRLYATEDDNAVCDRVYEILLGYLQGVRRGDFDKPEVIVNFPYLAKFFTLEGIAAFEQEQQKRVDRQGILRTLFDDTTSEISLQSFDTTLLDTIITDISDELTERYLLEHMLS